jgi:hypothetical protein
MECRSGGVVRSVGALRCGRQLFFRLCVSFVSQDMDECTCNVDARWRAGETHDVAPIRGRAGATKAGSGEAAYGLGKGNKGDVRCRVQILLTLKGSSCCETRSSPEDSAMKRDVEVECAISGQRLFRRAESGRSRMPAGRRVLG